jgi:D-3-phosphoglycerate dehydrogenase
VREEPLDVDHPLRGHGNVLLSCHTAGATRQSLQNVFAMTVDNVRAAIEGRPVANVVNGIDPVVVNRR